MCVVRCSSLACRLRESWRQRQFTVHLRRTADDQRTDSAKVDAHGLSALTTVRPYVTTCHCAEGNEEYDPEAIFEDAGAMSEEELAEAEAMYGKEVRQPAYQDWLNVAVSAFSLALWRHRTPAQTASVVFRLLSRLLQCACGPTALPCRAGRVHGR